MGYLSSSSPHIISGAISALSLLIYNDADFCLAVPNLLPSVLFLLQNKDIEVIKVSFSSMFISGFGLYLLIRNLICAMTCDRQLWASSRCWFPPCRPINCWNWSLMLSMEYCHGHLFQNIISDQRHVPLEQCFGSVNDICCQFISSPVNSCHVIKKQTKFQVAVILEILTRKCGFDAIDIIVPKNYKAFVKTIEEVKFFFGFHHLLGSMHIIICHFNQCKVFLVIVVLYLLYRSIKGLYWIVLDNNDRCRVYALCH